jgi:hypothetical protein
VSDDGRWRGRLARARNVGAAGVARRVRDRLTAPARARHSAAWQTHFAGCIDPPVLLARCGLPVDPSGLARLRDAIAGGPFFFDLAAPGLAEAFVTRHPEAHEALLAQADAAARGDLRWVVPGGTTDWHRALPGHSRWPLVASGGIDYGGERPLGDVRLAWEIGRGTHLVRLGQASWLTGDAGPAKAALEELARFAAQNPPGLGIGWAQAQEVALRAVALLWVFHLTRGHGVFDAERFGLWLALLVAHAEFVAANLSDHPVTHNHLVSEAGALALLGIALPALPVADRWRRLGARVLWREIAKQIDDEGISGEHSIHYSAFELDTAVATLLLAERAGMAVPAAARARVGAMADAAVALLRADGTLPPIGDTDAGRALRLGADPLDRRDVLAAAAVAFDRSDWGAVTGDAPGAFWLTGGRAVPGAAGAAPGGFARRFEAAGIGLARTGRGPDEEIVVFRAGPTRLRVDVLASHAHADALSVLWRVGGEDVLLDPGTYLYSEASGWRAWLRGTRAHACVALDGRDQADVSSARFGIAGLQPARWLHFAGDGRRLAAAAEHPAHGAPRVRRRLAWAPGVLVLVDDVLGDGVHTVDAWLPLPATRGEASGTTAILALASGRELRVEGFCAVTRIHALRPALGAGPGPGWAAPRYGVLAAGTALQLEAGSPSLPARLVTVLQLGEPGATAPALVEDLDDAALRVRVGRHRVRFDGAAGAHFEETS